MTSGKVLDIQIPDGLNDYRPKSFDEWEPIIDLSKKAVQDFPEGIFPDWLETFIDHVSTSTQSPRDMSCMMAIGVLSTALMRKYHVQLDRTWKVPLNTYSVLLAEPSERKTPTFKPFIFPVAEFEKENAQLHDMEENSKEFRRQTLSIQNKAKRQQLEKMTKSDASQMEIDGVIKSLSEISENLRKNAPKNRPVTTISNITPEEFDRILAENNETLSIASSESTFFSDFGGAYVSGNARVRQEGILSAYESDSYKVHRVKDREKGQNGLYLEKPLASVYVMVQPTVLQHIPDQLKERGLLDRFLYFKPKSLVGYRTNDNEPISKVVQEKYNQMIFRALSMDMDDKKLILKDDAQELFKSFRNLIEEDLKEGNELHPIKGWGGKLAGNIGRIIGLLHVAEHLESGNIPQYITKTTVLNAMDLSGYFSSHAKQTFDIVGISEVDTVAKKIVELLTTNPKFKDESIINVSTLKGYLYGRGQRKDEIKEDALFTLQNHNYIRLFKNGRKKQLKVNPELSNELSRTK